MRIHTIVQKSQFADLREFWISGDASEQMPLQRSYEELKKIRWVRGFLQSWVK
jgi:hypothetical protein